uniref:NOP protein chaperone 1 n=1 Tax=Canis lupus familiaris TaxID=9615 RepID=A0A8C0S561_CANLF
MEVRGEPQAGASCSSSPRGRSAGPVSKELLTAGSGGRRGIWDRLLIQPKPNCRKNATLQTVRVERSPLLDQVQTFLPQMAQANEKLRKEMAAASPGRFNIEDIDGALGKVIQMSSLYNTCVWTELTACLIVTSHSSAALAYSTSRIYPDPATLYRVPCCHPWSMSSWSPLDCCSDFSTGSPASAFSFL